MKKLFLPILLATLCSPAQAARDVALSTVNYVYQLDSEDTVFEFNSSVANTCGSNSYRVKSPSEAVASRKFALVLTAFTAKNNLAFHDTQICESGRSVVSWIRITN